MEGSGVERRLAAILAADVVGYSRLMEADEAGTHARLKALRQELIEPAIARFVIWRRSMIAAAAALATVVAGGVLWSFYLRPAPPAQVAAQSEPLKLPSKPSIAVLPFANLNDDPEEELLIDGLSNDIITDLSKFSTLFVIAANSTFQYKGKAVNVQDVARDLGVRYVLEGSVQRSNDTLRINAQLIDATTGAHVWAERYDRPANDFFAVQNEITRNVVGVIYPIAEGRGKLQKVELERIEHTPTENLEAYDYFLRGMVYMDRFTKEDNLRGREMFEKAIELDPSYARAMGKNVWTYLLEYWNGWSDNPEQSFEQAMQMAKRGIAADPNEPWAHWGLASALVMQKRFGEALREYEKAYDLNPNDANVVTELGWGLALMGRAEEGIPLMQQAMRLNPFHPDWYWTNLGEGYFMAGRYEESVAALEQITEPWSRIYQVLAASYAQAGRIEEARAALAKHLKLEPQMTLEHAVVSMPFNAEGQERYLDGLRKAGLPEKAPAPGT